MNKSFIDLLKFLTENKPEKETEHADNYEDAYRKRQDRLMASRRRDNEHVRREYGLQSRRGSSRKPSGPDIA